MDAVHEDGPNDWPRNAVGLIVNYRISAGSIQTPLSCTPLPLFSLQVSLYRTVRRPYKLLPDPLQAPPSQLSMERAVPAGRPKAVEHFVANFRWFWAESCLVESHQPHQPSCWRSGWACCRVMPCRAIKATEWNECHNRCLFFLLHVSVLPPKTNCHSLASPYHWAAAGGILQK